MITKFQKFLITESPDTIEIADNDFLSYEDDDAIPFFTNVNIDHTQVENIFLGNLGDGDCHGDIDYNGRRGNKSYPGRLWLNSKIMGFWVYPNEELFKSIIETLEEKLEIKIFNNGWKIEVIKKDNKVRKNEFNPDKDDYFFGDDDNYFDNTEIIPIERYMGSEDIPEEQQIMHLMNWKEKEAARKAGKLHFPKTFGSYLTGWDSKNNIAWRQAKYQESVMVKETPDHMNYTKPNGRIVTHYYSEKQAKPFFVQVNSDHTEVKKLHMGNFGDAHSDIKKNNDIDNKAYAGRVWTKIKCISFWSYPNEKLFVSLIKAIEKKLKIKIFNNGWQVEVKKTDDKIRRVDPNNANKDFYFWSRFNYNLKDYNEELVPVEEYAGSENPPEDLRIQHMLSWKEKEQLKQAGKIKTGNFGSNLTAWDSPHNIKWRQAKYQENKKY